MNNWKETTLGEVVEIFTGKKDVNQTNLDGEYIFFSCSPETFRSNDYICDDEAIIIVGNGSYTGTVRFYEGKFDLYQRTYACTLKKDAESNFDIKFLFYYVKRYFEHKFMGGTRGSSIPYIVRGDIENFEIPYPALPEQEAIAAILSGFDDKIELLRRQNKTLEFIAQTIFKEWFIKFKVKGEKLKLNNKTGLPEEWRIGKLEEVIEIQNGFAFKSEDYVENGIPVVRTTNFAEGTIILDDVVYLTEEKAKEFEKFYLSKFDFLLVMVGASIGKSVITPSYILPALQNQNMWNFKAKDNVMKFYSILFLKILVEQEANSASGSARDFFRKDHFYSLDILIPEPNILQTFDRLVSSIFEKIDTNISQIQTLSRLRDALLPKLMKGEIRVKL